MATEQTKNYELAFLLHPDLSEEEILTNIQKIRNIISTHQGIVGKEDTLKKTRLGFPIKKQNYAYFGNIVFSADSKFISEIKKELRMEEKMLRFLILAVSKQQLKETKRLEEKLKAKIPSRVIEIKPKEKKMTRDTKDVLPKKETVKEEGKAQIEDLDKKLEEILGE